LNKSLSSVQLYSDVTILTVHSGMTMDIPNLQITSEPIPTKFFKMPAGRYTYTIRKGAKIIKKDSLEVTGLKIIIEI